MFIKSAVLVALVGAVSALPVKRQEIDATTTISSYVPKATPAGYASGYLEDYQIYHQRYLAINCQDHRNATNKDDFFLECCSPLLATENITEVRAAYCIPSNETLSSVESTYNATATDSLAEEEFCDEATSVVEAISSIAATATESLSVVTLTETESATASATNVYTLNVLKALATSTSSSAEVEATPSSSSSEWVAPSSSSSSEEWVAPSTTSTSEWVAPTTSAYVEPTTEAWIAPTTSEAAPATTQAASSGNWIGNAYATYFYQNGNAGACGVYNSDSAHIVAIPSSYYGSYGSASGNCGRWINIRRTDTGATVSAQVADVCPTCTTGTSIDLSYGAFTAIASTGEGMVPVEWQWQ